LTNLPTNGRVVVIDDKIEEEALPLIEALSRKGVPVHCFSGRGSSLPKEPINGIRLIFLDFLLEGMDFDNDTADVVKSLKPVVERLIDHKNGPFILIGWTRTPQHINALVDSLEVKPIAVIDMEKADCFSDSTKIMEKIETKIFQKLESLKSLNLLFAWENLVNDSAGEIVNEYVSMTGAMYDENNLRQTILRMASAHTGRNIDQIDNHGIVKHAFGVLNTTLSDRIDYFTISDLLPEAIFTNGSKSLYSQPDNGNIYDILSIDHCFVINKNNVELVRSSKNQPINEFINEVKKQKKDQAIISLCPGIDHAQRTTLKSFAKNEILDETGTHANLKRIINNERSVIIRAVENFQFIAAKINNHLFLDFSPHKLVCPGNVYSHSNEDKRDKIELMKIFFKNDFVDSLDSIQLSRFQIIEVEVTPPCDYAQKKWKNTRLVTGIIFPIDESTNLIESSKASYNYIIPPFIWDQNICKSIFDFRYISSKSFNMTESLTLFFRLKQELLSDVISNLADNMGRLGLTFLE
jgi:hypothetical protein